jgi:radical SAM superfamily enzyme YgiQ (UPF0313 family)
MNILLINPSRDYGVIMPKGTKIESPHFPPLGLLYVASSLLDEGYNVKVLDLFAEKNPNEKIKKSLDSTDVVGFSVNSYSYNETSEIAKKIKEIDHSIPIIIGGPHCSFHPKKSLIDVPEAEIAVIGDGELVIKDAINAIIGKKKLANVSGIYYKNNGNIKKGKPAEIIKNLDSISFPARHLVDKYEYGIVNNSYFFKPKVTSTATTRGCPFKCRFCSRNNHLKRFRQRSINNVVDEIIEINDNYGSVIITDENFLTDTKRAHGIFDSLIEFGSDINLIIEGTRVDTAEEGLYKKMKKAGVKFIAFGIESGNQNVLDYYNKKITINQIEKAVKLANQMGFICWGNFILGAPIETEREIENTINFACSLPLDFAIFNPLCYMWGSELWNEAVENGKIRKNDGYSIVADSKIGLGNFIGDELTEYCKIATQRFFFRPKYVIGQFMKAVRTMNFSLLPVLLKSL